MIRTRVSPSHPQRNSTAITLLVVILVLSFLLSACVSASNSIPPVEPTTTPTPIPTGRGAGGTLRILNPQAPVILNPHLANSAKDLDPSRIVYEPLASFDKDGNLFPVLASEIPSLENGGLSEDGTIVTWKIKPDVKWSDGSPFSADDVVFTYEYITNPDVKAVTASFYNDIESVTALDPTTVQIKFKAPTPAWFRPFVGYRGVILPRHIFEPYAGANAREAPANTLPIGTGPYYVIPPGIKPQEVLLLGSSIVETNKTVFEPNPYFRETDKPFFKRIEWRGGGTAGEALRQLGNGEVDLVFGIGQLPKSVLQPYYDKGMIITNFGGNVYRILLNHTDPNKETADGERSSITIPHPILSDKLVRQAFAHAINRDALAEIYGSAGRPVTNNLVVPPRYASDSEFYPYDLEKAKALLEEAGWVDTNGDGIREKDGAKLNIVLQAETGAALKSAMDIIKESLEQIGVDVELKIVPSNIMFGPCATNPDSTFCFNSDLQIVAINHPHPDPAIYMRYWICSSAPQKANNWTGYNIERWCNQEYDDLYNRTTVELDPAKRTELFIQMNDLQIEDVVMIPTVLFAAVLGVNPSLTDVVLSPWDRDTANIKDWRFTTP